MIHNMLHTTGVLELILERPPVNAFDIETLNRLAEFMEGATQRQEVRSVIVLGIGRGFCGGGDVKEVEALPGCEGILGQSAGSLRMSLAALNCAVPVISAIHNYCVGVGVLLAGVSDMVIASKGTRFVLAEVDNGATSGAIQALKLMPEKRARAAMMTALPVQAEELYQYGSIFRLVDEEQLRETAMHMASVIASKNPQTIRRLKLSMNGTTKAFELQTAYRAEISYT